MSSSSTKCILPGELIDRVIDHLHDDLPSLRACCIACRAWVASARFHIFHDIVLSTELTNVLRVLVLLENSPHIFALVRSLTIKGHYDMWSHYLNVVIPLIAPKLTRLKTLRVHRVTLALQHPKVLSALIHNFSTLQELSIIAVTFKRFGDFATLIVEHPFLKYLDLGEIRWNESVTAASHWENMFQEYPDLRSRLRCVGLHNLPPSSVDWISEHYHILAAHMFTRPTFSLPLSPQMARIIQLLGSSLEHLTLRTCQVILESPEKAKMDLLSLNTRLRTLTFDYLLLSKTSESYAWVPTLLSQVTSRYMEEISFVNLFSVE
ncbi:hypothetical protein JB92DRAFT_3148386 [Gautieria morchelliformis]|nr:hypothetical protein JB92DRAFT_3148386 [Gautieria morchelliformis]